MTILELGALGEFLGSVLTLATLAYLATQIRQNTAQQKREEIVSIQHGQNNVLAQLRDPLVCGAFVRGAAARAACGAGQDRATVCRRRTGSRGRTGRNGYVFDNRRKLG